MGAREIAQAAESLYDATKASVVRQTEAGIETKAGAKALTREIAECQRQLRDLKRHATEEERQIRDGAKDARAKAAGTGTTIGMFTSSKTRGALARSRASTKQSVSKREAAALGPYRELKSAIDGLVAELQGWKDQITGQMDELDDAPSTGGTSSTPAPPPPPQPPPAWAPDPSGRNELRYWDGQRWTEHVSSQGVQGVDAL